MLTLFYVREIYLHLWHYDTYIQSSNVRQLEIFFSNLCSKQSTTKMISIVVLNSTIHLIMIHKLMKFSISSHICHNSQFSFYCDSQYECKKTQTITFTNNIRHLYHTRFIARRYRSITRHKTNMMFLKKCDCTQWQI